MIALANFIGLPLLFVSTIADRPRRRCPDWMQCGRARSTRWTGACAPRARSALAGTHWEHGRRCTSMLLVGFTVATTAFATWASAPTSAPCNLGARRNPLQGGSMDERTTR